jgi:hypothetical protein
MKLQRALLVASLPALGAVPAAADCYKVGAGGTHAQVQPAIDAALAPGGLDCIRVAAGHRLERLSVPDRLAGRNLTISGGWTDAFLRQTGSTTLDGGGVAPVVSVTIRSGNLWLSHFRVGNGNRPPVPFGTGGGLRLTVVGTAVLRLEDSEVVNNRMAGEGGDGGGLWADLDGSAVLRIVRTTFAGNAVQAATGQAFGGGASISARGTARVAVLESQFNNNEVSGPEFTEAAALDLWVGQAATAEVMDNTFLTNRTLSTTADAWGAVKLSAGRVDTEDTAQIEARRNRIQQNVVQRAGGHQLELRATGATTVRVTDTLVSSGGGTGVLAWPTGGTMYLTNLTVSRQATDGVRVIGGAETVFLSNSILFGNGTDLDGEAQLRNNLIGVDPLFLDAAAGDFHLAPASPAVNAGAVTTPGGLGPLDLDRNVRVQGPLVDQGAYETSIGPGHDGPLCRVRDLGIPAPRYTAVCRCLSDDSLREFHCGFFTPELFVAVRFPFSPPAGQPLPLEVSLQPWASVGTGAYSLRTELRSGGQWVPQPWLGPVAPSLKRGQVVAEPFRVTVPPGAPTPLRTLISYPRRPGLARGVLSLDLVLPNVAPLPPQ